MAETITINADTCKACGGVCPNRVMPKADTKMALREDRTKTCIKCGQCMAVWPTMSIKMTIMSYLTRPNNAARTGHAYWQATLAGAE